VQKRLIAATARARLDDQIPRERRSAPGLELIEADHAAQHPVDRPRRQPRRLLRQHHHVLGRPPRPRRELAQLHHADPVPAQPALAQERPERAQVVSVRLDRIRRALAISQPRQVLIDELDRPQIRTDNRERLDRARRQNHAADDEPPIPLADVMHVQNAGNITSAPDVKTSPSLTS
jgi:hypothetical protein